MVLLGRREGLMVVHKAPCPISKETTELRTYVYSTVPYIIVVRVMGLRK